MAEQVVIQYKFVDKHQIYKFSLGISEACFFFGIDMNLTCFFDISSAVS